MSEAAGMGARLRARREQLGVSLEEAARVTRISKAYLQAIEQDDLGRLPSPAYARGFIRVYAGYLGFSATEVQPAAGVVAGATPDDSQAELPPAAAPSRSRRRFPWQFVIVTLVCVAILSWFIEREERPVRPLPPAPQPAAAPAPPAVQTPVSSVRAPAPSTAAPLAEPAPASATSGLVLRLRLTQDGSLDVTVDGALSQHYQLKSGDLIEWKAERTLSVDLGNPAGVEAELNGRPYRLPAGRGHLDLQAESSPPAGTVR